MKIMETIDPDVISKLDKNSNIIICIPPIEKDFITESEEFPDCFKISLAKSLNLSTEDVTKTDLNKFSANLYPKIKIMMPAGLRIQFSENYQNHLFDNLHKSFEVNNVYDENNKLSYHIITKILITTIIDAVKMIKTNQNLIIDKGTLLTEFYFTWYTQTSSDMPQIENIYMIYDQDIFNDFANII